MIGKVVALDLTRCCKVNYKNYYSSQCKNKGSVERDGKLYCGVHDPIAVNKRVEAATAKFNAKWESKKKAMQQGYTAVLPEVACPKCRERFGLTWMDSCGGPEETLHISYCESGGVYMVEITCPHCNHKVELK